MKTPKIASAMNNIDDELISGADKPKARKFGVTAKIMSVAAAFAIIFCASFLAVQMFTASAVDATVAIDVNPSIEIEVNKKDKVVKVNAVNEDAEAILADLELEKTDVNTAISAIIGKMFEKGYLSAEKNSVLVSVDTKNEKKAEKLKQNALLQVEAAFKTEDEKTEGEAVTPAIVIQDYKKNDKAKEEKVSAAKSALIEKIVEAGLKNADGVAYTAEELSAMKVHELLLLLDIKGVKVGNVEHKGEICKKEFADKEEIVAFVYEAAKLTEEQIAAIEEAEVEVEAFKGGIVYEVEFEIEGVEYEYKVRVEKDTMFIVGNKAEENKGDDRNEEEKLPEDATLITEAEAVAAAKAHAGIEAEVEAKVEREGRCYEVEFTYDGCEYEYKIDAVSGKLVSAEKDMEIDLGKHEGGKPQNEKPDQWGHKGNGHGGDDDFDDDRDDDRDDGKDDDRDDDGEHGFRGEGKAQMNTAARPEREASENDTPDGSIAA